MNIKSCILLGDTHFGEKSFNKDFFQNQMRFFKDQLIPYMKENDIRHILQLGDLLHNRVNMDISFFDQLCVEFFDYLKEQGIELITFLGNHDIYYKTTRDVNLVKYIDKLYDNITLISKQTTIEINKSKCLLVPWLLEDEDILYTNEEYIFGHFEIQSFQLARGSYDEKSKLKPDLFKKYTELKKIFSGHYHINQEKELIHYVGTPYQISWSDFGNNCGFYIFDGTNDYDFIPNTKSDIHVKLYWDERKDNFLSMSIDGNTVDIDSVDDLIKNNVVIKFFNYYSVNNSFEEVIFKLKEAGIRYTFYNEQELDTIINPDKIDVECVRLKNTDSFVVQYIKDNNPELVDLVEDILSSINT